MTRGVSTVESQQQVPDEVKSIFVLKYGYPERTKEWLHGLPDNVFKSIFPNTPWDKEGTIKWYTSSGFVERWYSKPMASILFANTVFRCYHQNYKPSEL
jgi:hypothetical protein